MSGGTRVGRDGRPLKQVHLAAHFPGVNHHTVWSDPRSGSQIDFSSFAHFVRTAERGLFDFFFQAEGLRVREHKGRFHDLDVAGRPDIATIQTALAGITEHLGYVGTINTTFNEPYDLARRLASADHLSGGRTGWNLVTTNDAFHGANFRRGGFLPREERYERAAEFVRAAITLWDSWDTTGGPEEAADGSQPERGSFDHQGKHFQIAGRFGVPLSPQRHPVLVQAGVSGEGRDFAARNADVVFSPFGIGPQAKEFFDDLRARAARAGRDPETLRVLPAAGFALGDTEAEATELAHEIALAQVSPATALVLLEQVWLRDLSDVDPDGPPPPVEESVVDADISLGRTRQNHDPLARAREWHDYAVAHHLSIRELLIAKTPHTRLVGTPEQVAERIDDAVQDGVVSGVIIAPHLVPTGLDDFVDRVVPLLQERGVHRTAYPSGATLRDLLDLPGRAPAAQDDVEPFSIESSVPTATDAPPTAAKVG